MTGGGLIRQNRLMHINAPFAPQENEVKEKQGQALRTINQGGAMETENRPLEGVKVVELATFIAIPAVGRILADMGADVVKIESTKGDNLRYTAPNEGRPSDPHEDTNFDLENANKKGIVLDVRTEKGKEILFKLLEDADILLTNWRPQALARQNLTYEDLKDRFPKLVYGNITGYGEKGPDKDRSARLRLHGLLRPQRLVRLPVPEGHRSHEPHPGARRPYDRPGADWRRCRCSVSRRQDRQGR